MRASLVLLSLVFVAVALPGLAAAQPSIPYSCTITYYDLSQDISQTGTPLDGHHILVPTNVQCYG